MSYAPAAPVLLGDQRPRLSSVPPADRSEGRNAVDLAALAGLELDPWQADVLEAGLGRRDGRWAAFEACLIVARQNGKGAVLEALELAALFLFDDVRLILHSAHEFKTAAEAFLRIRQLIEGRPEFERRVERIRTAAGAEAIELKDGKRLRFVARSSGSGRGFSSDLVILDEAYQLGDQEMAALLPTLSARPDPQVWYTSTAGFPTSTQLGLVRARGLSGCDPSLAFFEWSVDPDDHDPADERCWAQANPGLGIRITPEYIAKERAALSPEVFARERLSIGDYPSEGGGWETISADAWSACAVPGARL
jgi:phage terminase large subunit-like protein